MNSPDLPLNRISTHNGVNQTAFGLLDEIRLSDQVRSADWLWASYQTMASNTSFSCYSSVILQGGAELVLTKTASTNQLTEGTNFWYQIQVLNISTVTVGGVVVTDALPASVTFQSSTPNFSSQLGGDYIYNLADLGPGASTSITINVAFTGAGERFSDPVTARSTPGGARPRTPCSR